MTNMILNTDSYKLSHYKQYPPGTEVVSSYIEPRGWDKSFWAKEPEVVFFGLQAFIKQYLLTPISKYDVQEAAEVVPAHGLPFNREGWDHIVEAHGGFLPIQIRALDEGTVHQVGLPQVEVINTDSKVPWVTSYIETALLRAIWYPSTVATVSREIKLIIADALAESSDDPKGQLPFKLHDFGARGASSAEAAELGGMAHLVNFMGTDTTAALTAARRYYDAGMAGFSIPATEHSTITSWGREHEVDAYRNFLEQFKDNPIIACVSDSYNIYNAASNLWGDELKKEVVARNGILVIRPDSGDPLVVILGLLNILGEKFGFDVNSKGFKVLRNVRIIQGDGVVPKTIKNILNSMLKAGWSADNIAFGMGGGLLQKVCRDDLKYAMKANAIRIEGAWSPVYKDPVTDRGKLSKQGRQVVLQGAGRLVAHQMGEVSPNVDDLLIERYRAGITSNATNFEEIRKRAAI